MDFRDLIDSVRAKGRKSGSPPVTYGVIAKRCGMSRQHLYHLMLGARNASPWMMERIAKGLGVAVTQVKSALAK